jgi:hypothetical protein
MRHGKMGRDREGKMSVRKFSRKWLTEYKLDDWLEKLLTPSAQGASEARKMCC